MASPATWPIRRQWRRCGKPGWEIASHGLRWIDHNDIPEDEERAHIAAAIALHEQVCGARPLGWYTGRGSPNTLRLVSEAGGFLYASDNYADDLPYWTCLEGRSELIICTPSTARHALRGRATLPVGRRVEIARHWRARFPPLREDSEPWGRSVRYSG